MNTLTTEHTPDNIIASWLDDHQKELVNIADYIFHHPELAYQETLSSKCLADYLESQGFKITWKTAGIDTAFTRSEERRVGKECRSRWSPDH